jgi:hypothetical protein
MQFVKLLSIAALLASCLNPREIAVVGKESCTLVGLLDAGPTIESMCATAAELAAIAASVLAQRSAEADSGASLARKLEGCSLVPASQVCATPSELTTAIRSVKAVR